MIRVRVIVSSSFVAFAINVLYLSLYPVQNHARPEQILSLKNTFTARGSIENHCTSTDAVGNNY